MTAADSAPRTARVLTGYRPEDGFMAVELDPPPGEYVWHDEHAEQQEQRYGPGAGYHQWLAVDARDGAVWFGDIDWRAPSEDLGSQLPGLPRRALGDGAVPTSGSMVQLLGHLTHDEQRGCSWRFFTAEELHALALRILPAVQRLVDSIHRIGPDDELEWSAEAATAWDDIEQAATHLRPLRRSPLAQAAHDTDPRLACRGRRVPRHEPRSVRSLLGPGHGRGTRCIRRLQSRERLWRCTGADVPRRRPADRGRFHFLRPPCRPVRLPRAGVRRPCSVRRPRLAGDDRGGSGHLGGGQAPGATLADVPDCVLAALAEGFQNSAHEEGRVLTGLDAHLRRLRAEERSAVDQQLVREAEEVERLENMLKDFRAARNRTVTRILAWSDGRSDGEIARLASMPDDYVSDWRARLTDEQTTATPAT